MTVALLLTAGLLAQQSSTRYELAWRTRALEREWIAHPSAELHAEALPEIERSVQSFFALDMAAVAEALDSARAMLADEPEALSKRWPDGFAVVPARRLLDRGNDELELTVTRLYGEPDGRIWDLAIDQAGHETLEGSVQIASEGGGAWSSVLLQWPEGDYATTLTLSDGDFTTHLRPLAFSVVTKRDERLAALAKEIAALPETAPSLERESAKDTLALLESLATGSTEETDFPAARLLAETEGVVATAAKGERWYTPTQRGQFWLSIANGKKASRVRVLVPQELETGKTVPLVVALHGLGGSENMFFDAYGDGMIVKLCEERGWMLVAPRLAMFGGAPVERIVDALAERYPIDRSRLFLVGHSMGAGIGQSLVAKQPTMFRAFAALGGGQGIKDATALKALPVFVGAGERDFGRKGAEALHRSLVDAGSEVATLKAYPNCEHLMVVVDALPDVFAWFDRFAQ